MRTLIALCLCIACTGAPSSDPDPAPAPADDATAKRGADKTGRYPDQGPPTPADVTLAELPSWQGTAWSLSDGRTLRIDGDQATLGDETQSHTLAPGGGSLGERRIRLVTPCALALWENDTWIEASRTTPECSADELAIEPSSHVTWAFGGGDRYTFLPQGRVWRHGPERRFKHPVGSYTSGETGIEARFGQTEFKVHPVDPCHLALEIPKLERMNRATRQFPPCDPSRSTYAALPFTLWQTEADDRIDLHGPGVGKLDAFRVPGKQDLSWTPSEHGFDARVGERTLRVKVDGCTATIEEQGKPPVPAIRQWPACAQPSR